jgi:hypothetical protein
MTTEKHGSLNKHADATTKTKEKFAQEKHEERNKFGDIIYSGKAKDIDAQRHPEEQVVRDKPDLNGPPSNQKI